MSLPRHFAILGAAAVLIAALAPAAQARHHRHRAHAVKAAHPLPAHQRSDWIGIANAPMPGLVDVGLGPVFPFDGWPTK